MVAERLTLYSSSFNTRIVNLVVAVLLDPELADNLGER
jgi:hypothetical protein